VRALNAGEARSYGSVATGGTEAEYEFLSIVTVDDPGAREPVDIQSKREHFIPM
jgi:hypothetical protein